MKKQLSLWMIASLLVTSQLTWSIAATAPMPYGDAAAQYITKLETFAPRLAGSKAEAKTADYIKAQFTAMGLKPTVTPFDTEVQDPKTKKTSTLHSANVSAILAGSSKKQIIIGAHYDSVAKGKGADDNASGVAVLLETAKRLTSTKTKPYYTLKFITFGSEEVDLDGSTAYVEAMSKDEKASTVVMVNLDSLIAGDVMNVYGTEGTKGVYRDLALQYAKDQKLNLTTNQGHNPEYPYGTTIDASDHAAFKAEGIQYVYFEGTNWDLGAKDGYTQVAVKYGVNGEIWHTPFDTTDYLNKTFPKRETEHLQTFTKVLEYLLLYKPK